MNKNCEQGTYTGPKGEKHQGVEGRKANLQNKDDGSYSYFAQWHDDTQSGWWTIPRAHFKTVK